jgi:heterotetrameric sarcosine oxidase gamma subunit
MRDREAVQVTEIAGRAVMRLKTWSPNQPSASLVPPALGEEVRLLSFGPHEWLVVSDHIASPKLREQLRRHAAGEGIAAVDLSCAVKALQVEGSGARHLLAKCSGLDLHPSRFTAGYCTRTRLAQLAVIVDCTDPRPRFDLYVGRSYLQYLKSCLTDAAVEGSM